MDYISFLKKKAACFVDLITLIPAATALLVWIGWYGRFEGLKRVHGSWAYMKPNTAICFFLLSAAYFLFSSFMRGQSQKRWKQVLGTSFAACVCILSGLTVLEHFSGLLLGIDSLFFSREFDSQDLFPGRISPGGAICLFILGLSSLIKIHGERSLTSLCDTLILGVTFTGLFGCISYFYGLTEIYHLYLFSSLSFHASVCLFLSSISVLFLKTNAGFAQFFLHSGSGSATARSTIPVAAISIITIGWLRLVGQRMGWYGTEIGLAIMVTFSIGALFVVLWHNLSQQNEIEIAGQTERETFFQLPYHLLCVLDQTFHFLTVNLGFLNTLGYTKDEVIGRPIWDFLHPDDLDVTQNAANDPTALKTSYLENRYRTKIGTYVWLRWTGTKIGELHYSAAIDVTEERHQNELLIQSEKKFSAIYDKSPFPKFVISWPEAKICDVNAAWCGLYEFSRAEALDKTTLELGIVRNVENRAKLYELLKKENFVQNFELHTISKSGKALLVSNTAVRFEVNQKQYALFTQVNITEMRRNERQLLATFNQAAIGIGHVAPDGNFIKVNQKLCRIVGYSEEELLKCNFRDLTHPDDLEDGLILVDRLLKREIEQYNFEKRYIKKDQSLVWVNLSVALVWKPNQEPDYFIVIIEDIHSRKQMEHEKADLYLREQLARESSRLKSEFIANMSHELRTPINGVLGMTGLLLETSLTSEQKDFAETVMRSADSLLTVINDILDFSKIEAGKLEFEILDFDLSQLLNDVHKTMSFSAQKKHLDFSVQGDLKWRHHYQGDPGRIRQVIVNLLSNAIKFTEKGSISLSVVSLSESETKSVFRFEVKDTGIGISEKAKDKLFQAFSQADSTVTRRFGGTGLGLSISKRLIQLMGGEIGVTSQEGNGSLFWFTLALQKGTSLPENVPQAVSLTELRPKSGKAIRILLAEDNVTNQKVALAQLDALGLHADAVGNGKEALHALRSIPYDLILMDCQMPELDGYEATRQIRSSQASFRDIPILAMTANALSGDREKCLEAGMNDYISKPIRLKDLAKVLEKWILAIESKESPIQDRPK